MVGVDMIIGDDFDKLTMAMRTGEEMQEISSLLAKLARRLTRRIHNMIADMERPDGVYAYRFDDFGCYYITGHVTSQSFDENGNAGKIRIRAAMRRV